MSEWLKNQKTKDLIDYYHNKQVGGNSPQPKYVIIAKKGY